MNVRNFLQTPTAPTTHSPGGTGIMHFARVWKKDDFVTGWNFVDRVVLTPGSSIGQHQHGNDEEMYVVLAGSGLMTVNGETQRVGKGDMILNPPRGTHGFVNDTTEDVELLVVEVRV